MNFSSASQGRTKAWGAVAAAAAAATALGMGLSSSQAFAQSPSGASSAKSPDMWDRWDQVKNFLTGWRKVRGVTTDVPLPTDKLACHMPSKGELVKNSFSLKALESGVLITYLAFL